METSSYLIIAFLALTLGHYLLASMPMAIDTAYNNAAIQVVLGEKT